MNTFVWSGFVSGQRREGVLQAPSMDNAVSLLRSQSVVLTKITPQNLDIIDNEAVKRPQSISRLVKINIPSKEKLLFLKKLQTMLSAGLPIVDSLEMIIKQSTKKTAPVVQFIYYEVVEGVPLSECFRKFPKLFDIVIINLISAGEMSGQLDEFLDKAVAYTERQAAIRKAIKSAMTYPIVLLTVALIVVSVMLVKVVPSFQNLFASGGKELPLPTQVVVDISNFMRTPDKILPIIFVLTTIIVAHLFFSRRSVNYRRRFHLFLIKLPVIRSLIINSNLAKISMIVGNLYEAGVSLVDTLGVTKNSVAFEPIKDGLNEVQYEIAEGRSLSKSFAVHENLFPLTFTSLIQVGENSGQLSKMLGSVNEYYGAEFDDSVKQFTALLEPIMIVFMGIVIGGVLLAMYMPMFTMGDAL
jgi:type IV pilus assembly protein PilC